MWYIHEPKSWQDMLDKCFVEITSKYAFDSCDDEEYDPEKDKQYEKWWMIIVEKLGFIDKYQAGFVYAKWSFYIKFYLWNEDYSYEELPIEIKDKVLDKICKVLNENSINWEEYLKSELYWFNPESWQDMLRYDFRNTVDKNAFEYCTNDCYDKKKEKEYIKWSEIIVEKLWKVWNVEFHIYDYPFPFHIRCYTKEANNYYELSEREQDEIDKKIEEILLNNEKD